MNNNDKKNIHNPEEERLPESQEASAHEPKETPLQEAQEKAVQEKHEIDYKELFLRTNADFQNFKRRIERERGEWANIMQANVLEKILPIAEDLERALATATEKAPTEASAWLNGFALILKNLKKNLVDLGVEEISTKGAFNPEFHEALIQVDSPNHTSGHIVQELSKGYTFKGKVIKHAHVSVAK